MSFNLIPSVKPVIREAANMSNDGGGGNLGYMQRERDEKEKKNKFVSDESIFGKKNEADMFVGADIEIPDEYKFSFTNIVKKALACLKRLFQ